MKRIVMFAMAAVLLTSCAAQTPPAPAPAETLEFNDSAFYGEELAAHVRTMSPEDTVKVNIHLQGESHDALSVKLMIEEEHGIPVQICNAIENRDFEMTDPYAEAWYDSKRTEGEPSFADNTDEARLEYMREYERIREETRMEYYRELFAQLPLREGTEIDYRMRHVYEYAATAKELSELSRHGYVSYIFPWTEDPVEPPKSVSPAAVFTESFGDLELRVIFDKEEYAYGDTVNMQVSVYNGGDGTAYFEPICETGNNSVGDPDHKNGFYYISAMFYADGESRRDVSCCYGHDISTDDVKPTGSLEPDETMSKTYAFTPHKSYRFLGEGVDEASEWTVKTRFETVGETENEEYSFEVIIPRGDK